jgi:hypothetical protein
MSGSPGQLDEQQAQLVERLRAAGGAPVSFDELRAIGIENPALLCYELAAIGLPVTRTSAGEGMPALSVRLEPESEQQPAQAQRTQTDRAEQSVDDVAPASRARGRAPMLALAVTVVAVIAIVLAHQAGNGGGRVHTAGAGATGRRSPSTARQSGAAPGASAAVSPRITTGPVKSGMPTHVSPAAAVAFEAHGHQLLSEGSYGTAIGNLLAAIRDSGQSLVGCIEPASESCLTFAYALYDLGRALRLQGRDSEAISVLSERLRIDNQRPTVQHELELARGASA